MNSSLANLRDEAGARITLRPERPSDEAFLLELYASTRTEELALINWDAAARAALIQMQFNAMRRGYAGTFPRADFSIILHEETPVGRMVVNRASDEIRVVDLALLPAYRRRKIGGAQLRQLQTEAAQARKPLRLQVLKTNPAARLYARLGFAPVGEDDFYRQMEWRPAATD